MRCVRHWVTCPADVEEYVTDERERPYNYEEHFYPCYIEYDEPWDFHFCGNFVFVNKTKEDAIAARRNNLTTYIYEKNKEIEAAKRELKKLDKY